MTVMYTPEGDPHLLHPRPSYGLEKPPPLPFFLSLIAHKSTSFTPFVQPITTNLESSLSLSLARSSRVDNDGDSALRNERRRGERRRGI